MELNTEGAAYRDRRSLEMYAWPELERALHPLGMLIRKSDAVPGSTKSEVRTIASITQGCRHCQAHGAYALHLSGVPTSRIHALWDFENSDLFDEQELSIFRLARDASKVPNAVGPAHFEALRVYLTDRQIVEILAVVALSAFLNCYNDSVAVVTDQESADWATANLSSVGWEIGKHTGTSEEQRTDLPTFLKTVRAGRKSRNS